jgi:subtilisin family serine protease
MVPVVALAMLLGSMGAAPVGADPVDAGGGESRYIVRLDPAGSGMSFPVAAASLAVGEDVGVVASLDRLDMVVVDATAEEAEALALAPGVMSVTADVWVPLAAFSGDSGTTLTDRTNAEIFHGGFQPGRGGPSVVVDVDVAVLDTGVDASHPDLNVVGGVDCRSGVCVPVVPTDSGTHGTHVAGIVGARDDGLNTGAMSVVGVAPGARIWSVQVLHANGGALSWILAGIDWTIDHGGIEAANMSFGVRSEAPWDWAAALDAAEQAGVVMVGAAGNDGRSDTGSNTFLPATYPSVIAVAALSDNNGERFGAHGNCGGPRR